MSRLTRLPPSPETGSDSFPDRASRRSTCETLDRGQREALYRQILDILKSDVPAIWLAQLDDLYGARADLAWQPRADSLLWLGDAALAT